MSEKVLNELVDIFQPGNKDWLGDRITDDNPLTYHHIVKACNGGRKSINNGALLTKNSHRYLHSVLEKDDISTYTLINLKFKLLNCQKQPPTDEYYEDINNILGDRVNDFKTYKKLIKTKKH